MSGGRLGGSLWEVFRLCKTDLIVDEVLEVSLFDESTMIFAIVVFKILFIRTNTFAPDGLAVGD